jgi:alanine dehydrogenase
MLSAQDVARLLPVDRCIAAVEEAFRQLGTGEAPAPSVLGVHLPKGGFHIKAGSMVLGGRNYFAAKVNGNFPSNRKRGLPTIQGVVLLYDAEDGRVLAVMDSIELTARRTAAATAVAARHLARRDSSVITIIGCGVQAPAQLAALRNVMNVQRVYVHDHNPERAREFANAENAEAVADLAEATTQSDVIVTCTTSKEFLLFPEHVRAGTLVAGVGVDNEDKKELAPALLGNSKVVTDVTSQCVNIGDLHHAIDAGTMKVEAVHAALGDIVAGKKPGRESNDEIIVFDSTGIGLQDVAAAATVYSML